jgi:hypothetical protein
MNTWRDQPRRLAAALLLSCLALGCRGQSSESVSLVPVEGRVTLHDKPLARASITFLPKTKTGSQARGLTNLDGRYKLLHESGSPGAETGEYQVVLQVMDLQPKRPGDAASGPAFSPSESTPLTAIVPEGGGTLDFNLSP